MAQTLSTIGSIALFLSNTYPDLPAGISGNLIIFADLARSYVENYTGVSIGSNNIADTYQSVILDFARADILDTLKAQSSSTSLSLSEISLGDSGEELSAAQYRALGELKLRALGRVYQFSQSLS